MHRIVKIISGQNKGSFCIQKFTFLGWKFITKEEPLYIGIYSNILRENMYFSSQQDAVDFLNKKEDEYFKIICKKNIQ